MMFQGRSPLVLLVVLSSSFLLDCGYGQTPNFVVSSPSKQTEDVLLEFGVSTTSTEGGQWLNNNNNNNNDADSTLSADDPVFQFTISTIDENGDQCGILEKIESDINAFLTLMNPDTILEPFNEVTERQQEEPEDFFTAVGSFFEAAVEVVTNTVNTFVDVVVNTSPQCSADDDIKLREIIRSFAACNGLDLDELSAGYSKPVLETGLTCVSEVFPEIGASQTSNSRRRRSLSGSFCDADESVTGAEEEGVNCTAGILGENVLGQLFRLVLVQPESICSCIPLLDELPDCHTIWDRRLVDGGRLKRYSCLMETETCPFFEDACTDRLNVLDQCLPSLDAFQSSEQGWGTCQDVMCQCETVNESEGGQINYAAQLMQLPLADMCQNEAINGTNSNFTDVPQRYELLQSACGYADEEIFNQFFAAGRAKQMEEMLEPEEEILATLEENPELRNNEQAEPVTVEQEAETTTRGGSDTSSFSKLNVDKYKMYDEDELMGRDSDKNKSAFTNPTVWMSTAVVVATLLLLIFIWKKRQHRNRLEAHTAAVVDYEIATGKGFDGTITTNTNAAKSDDNNDDSSKASSDAHTEPMSP